MMIEATILRAMALTLLVVLAIGEPRLVLGQEIPEFSGVIGNTAAVEEEEDAFAEFAAAGITDVTPLGLTVLGVYGFDSDFDLQSLDIRYGETKKARFELRYTSIDIDGLSGALGQTRLRLTKDLYNGPFSLAGRLTYTDQEDSYNQISLGAAFRFKSRFGITPMAEIEFLSRDQDLGPTTDTFSGKVAGGLNLIPGIYTEGSYTFDNKIQDEGAFELLALKELSSRFLVGATWQERGLAVLIVRGSF